MGRNESSSGTVENCYYLKGEGYPDTGIGGEKDTTGQAEGKNNDAFESGAVAYLLNGSNSEDTAVWRQNLDNGAVPDRFPVPDDSHGVVYEVEDGEDVRYSNSADGTWTISGCTVTLSAYTFTYDGKEQTPKVESVQWGEEKKPLTEGTDYTVTLPKSKDADTYTVTITGKGTYAGEVEVTYTIEKATLTAAYVGETVPAGGSPKLVVTVDGFVNGETADTAAGYTAPGIVSITQIDTNSYTLTPGGGSATNYDFEYESATLTFQTADPGGDTDPDDPGGDTGTGGSSGGGSPTYRPDVAQPEGGEITVSPQNPHRGDTVTVTPEPDEGYEVDTVTVTDKNGNEVGVTDNGDGTFSFTQPSGKVTIEVTFREIAPAPLPFTDVAEGAWYESAVRYAYTHGIMEGMSATSLTRAQAVQILYNLEGKPEGSGTAAFPDLVYEWYKPAIAWAESTGVVDGYEDGTFRPDEPVTREEFAQMLYNYATYKDYDLTATGDLSSFPDGDQVQKWALPAMTWANGNELINGHDDGTLEPGGTATRAQAAAILMRFDQNLVE